MEKQICKFPKCKTILAQDTVKSRSRFCSLHDRRLEYNDIHYRGGKFYKTVFIKLKSKTKHGAPKLRKKSQEVPKCVISLLQEPKSVDNMTSSLVNTVRKISRLW